MDTVVVYAFAFAFTCLITIYLFRGIIVEKGKGGTKSFGCIIITIFSILWTLAMLQISTVIWSSYQNTNDLSVIFGSPAFNGFIVGAILHFILVVKKKTYGFRKVR